tara:strand:- start:149 stop:604 length:456 start_codon:yes stop_codon:yes gene_type:complete
MGIVYKILCNETGECYIGSAKNITCYKYRKSNHKTKGECSSKQIIERGNYTFSIIEENIFIDTELRQREQYWIDISVRVINSQRAYLSKEQRKEYNKKIKSLWDEKNKEKIRQQNNEKFNCECGGRYTFVNISKHLKTKLHQDYLKLNVEL